MSDETREGLAEVLAGYLADFDTVMNVKAEARGVAHAVLASNWLAERDARIKAEARGEAEALRAKLAAVEAVCEAEAQRAYMAIALEKMLTVMPHPDYPDRAFIAPHWRELSESAARVQVAAIRAALADQEHATAEGGKR